MVEEVEAERTEVEEGCYESPILSHHEHTEGKCLARGTHLALEEDGPDAVEQLEW